MTQRDERWPKNEGKGIIFAHSSFLYVILMSTNFDKTPLRSSLPRFPSRPRVAARRSPPAARPSPPPCTSEAPTTRGPSGGSRPRPYPPPPSAVYRIRPPRPPAASAAPGAGPGRRARGGPRGGSRARHRQPIARGGSRAAATSPPDAACCMYVHSACHLWGSV